MRKWVLRVGSRSCRLARADGANVSSGRYQVCAGARHGAETDVEEFTLHGEVPREGNLAATANNPSGLIHFGAAALEGAVECVGEDLLSIQIGKGGAAGAVKVQAAEGDSRAARAP